MMKPTEPITEVDLDAYVDDQLDAQRRREVQAYLASHPDHAMRVMADLEIRDTLRAAQQERAAAGAAQGPAARERTHALAQRLDRAHWRARLYRRLRPAATTALLVSAGWTGHAGYAAWTRPEPAAVTVDLPSVVDDAVRAHRASLARAAMASQPDVPVLDVDEILDTLGVAIPSLPADWRVRDVQVFPSSTGLAVEVLLDASPRSTLSVFAARAPGSAVPLGRGRTRADQSSVVYWQHGPWAYAVTAELPEPELDLLASRLDEAGPTLH